jgi:hypothetical protein
MPGDLDVEQAHNTPNSSSQPAFACQSSLFTNHKKVEMRALWWRYTTRTPPCEDSPAAEDDLSDRGRRQQYVWSVEELVALFGYA